MIAISRAMRLAIVVSGLSSCMVTADDHELVASSPLTASPSPSGAAPSFCGVSPTGITYWASAWQLEILDADGIIGGCEFDASCLPSCWGGASDFTTWNGPLIQCPCR